LRAAHHCTSCTATLAAVPRSPEVRRIPLTLAERRGVVVAAESAFLKLANLYEEQLPIFARYGFKPQSAGVVSRDVSEKIEEQIILHCKSFTRGAGFADLSRHGQRWEVKICKGKGLTINQNAQVGGENYIVVNYTNYSSLRRVWVLWEAEDRFFTPRKPNLNLRTILPEIAASNIEVIFDTKESKPSGAGSPTQLQVPFSMAKADLSAASKRKKSSA
jgi:hypothetical protein